MSTEKMFGQNQQKQLPQNQMPQIILNQPGADLINRLLDVALKGGGLENLALVKEVITITNHRPAPPQVEEKKQEPTEFDNRKTVKDKELPDNPGNKDPRAK